MPDNDPPIVRWVRRLFDRDEERRTHCVECGQSLATRLPRWTSGYCGESCEFAALERS